MKNVLYLVLAIVFFGLAYYAWIIANENGLTESAPATRSLSPRKIGPPPSELVQFVKQWQPVLTLASSLGGIVSFVLQVRVWMRSRA